MTELSLLHLYFDWRSVLPQHGRSWAGLPAGASDAPMRAMLQLQRVATSILAAQPRIEDALGRCRRRRARCPTVRARSTLRHRPARKNAMRPDSQYSTHRRGIKLRLGSGLVGACAVDARVVNVCDAYADERFDPTVDLCTARKTQSSLCVPILGEDARVAAVLCALKQVWPRQSPVEVFLRPPMPPSHFPGPHEYLLSSIAVMAGHTLSRMRSQFTALPRWPMQRCSTSRSSSRAWSTRRKWRSSSARDLRRSCARTGRERVFARVPHQHGARLRPGDPALSGPISPARPAAGTQGPVPDAAPCAALDESLEQTTPPARSRDALSVGRGLVGRVMQVRS